MFGVGLALTGNSIPDLSKTQQVSAGTILKLEMPNNIQDPILQGTISRGFSLNSEEKALEDDSITISSSNSLLVDSLKQRINYLEKKKQVTMVKYPKNTSPPMAKTDTIYVPVYYMATKTGMKEGPDGSCISVYEVHEVDKVCPEINNSSAELSNESDNNMGE